MKAPERYWRLLRLTMQGQRRVEELPPCRQCLETQCLGTDAVPSDAVVQRQLQTLMQTAACAATFPTKSIAPVETCLVALVPLLV